MVFWSFLLVLLPPFLSVKTDSIEMCESGKLQYLEVLPQYHGLDGKQFFFTIFHPHSTLSLTHKQRFD